MFRKLTVVVSIVALLSIAAVATAAPVAGCYVDASALTINEDTNVTLTVKCDDIPTSNNVFAFQLATAPSGDIDATTLPTNYTAASDAGGFNHTSTGMTNPLIVGSNSISGLYAVSRVNNEVVSTEDFTLGSYILRSDNDLTTSGTITVNLTDASFMLSNNNAVALSGWLRDTNDVTITVTDVDLAWLSGNMDVRSDFTTITSIDLVELDLGDAPVYSATNVASYTRTFVMDSTYQYFEAGSPASDGTLNISGTADMTGHLACSTAVINLADTGSASDVDSKIGTTGVITLKAGDANDDGSVNISDVTLVGANFGTGGSSEEDINGDSAINILDLVFVGRNYTATSGSCGTGS